MKQIIQNESNRVNIEIMNNKDDEEAAASPNKNKESGTCLSDFNILELLSNRNLFFLCCIAACFSLISYLAAFSCEISWILEAHGNLPTTSYLLCSGYFILFVASTILIHGLATGLSWGLFSWSVIIGCLAIPELCLVMMITTQYWGIQSMHGLTELISYIVRLIINCLALLCVIPTALRWRREQEVLEQLQGLASRLQMSTPTPSTPKVIQHHQQQQQQQHLHQLHNPQNPHNPVELSRQNTSRPSSKRKRRRSGVDNPAFIVHESQIPFPYAYGVYGSQNEFNASIFGLDPSYYIGSPPMPNGANRTRSLLDLRNIMSPTVVTTNDKIDGATKHHDTYNVLNNNKEESKESTGDPIYYTISDKVSKPSPPLRNCVSLENLGGINIQDEYKIQHLKPSHPHEYNPFSYQGFSAMHQYHHFPHCIGPPPIPYPYNNNNYWNWSSKFNYNDGMMDFTNTNNPYVTNRSSNTNSKQSLGSDDYRKYRDVAL